MGACTAIGRRRACLRRPWPPGCLTDRPARRVAHRLPATPKLECLDRLRAVSVCHRTTDVVVFLDGKRVPVTEVTSGLLRLDLPADNIFGVPAGMGSPPYLSVADGWVALLHPLTPGRHTIMLNIVAEFPPGTPLKVSNTTTIIVKPGS